MLSIFRSVLILSLLLCGQGVFALPTQHLWVPESFVLPTGHCRMDLQNHFAFKRGQTGSRAPQFGVGGSCGLGQVDSWGVPVSFEAGLDWQENFAQPFGGGLDPLQLHMQVSAWDLTQHHWAVGMGMHSFGVTSTVEHANLAYGIIQNFSDPWLLGLGAYSGNSGFLMDHQATPLPTGVMAGIWRYTPRGLFSLEWMSGAHQLGALVLGGGIILPGNTRISLGLGLANNRELNSDWLLLKVSLDFAWLNAMKQEVPFHLKTPQLF